MKKGSFPEGTRRIAVLQSKDPGIPKPVSCYRRGVNYCGFPRVPYGMRDAFPWKGWFKTRRTSHLSFYIPYIHGHL